MNDVVMVFILVFAYCLLILFTLLAIGILVRKAFEKKEYDIHVFRQPRYLVESGRDGRIIGILKIPSSKS